MSKSYSIVASSFIKDAEAAVAALPDNHPVLLVREPQNEHDRNAIAVWAHGRKVGYLPKKQNVALAAFIDQAGTDLGKVDGGLGLSAKEIMAMDANDPNAPAVMSKTFPAKFFRSPNSRFPMVEVAVHAYPVPAPKP